MRLAAGISVTVKKRVLEIYYTSVDEEYDDFSIVLGFDGKNRCHLRSTMAFRFKSWISWYNKSVRKTTV